VTEHFEKLPNYTVNCS